MQRRQNSSAQFSYLTIHLEGGNQELTGQVRRLNPKGQTMCVLMCVFLRLRFHSQQGKNWVLSRLRQSLGLIAG